MGKDNRILSAQEEEKLLKPIDEYVGKIQEQIDALRVDGADRVQTLKTHISLAKEDKNYTKEERVAVIEKDKAELEKARSVESANKDKIAKLIADAEKYLADHYDSEYYQRVVASCEAEKEIETAEYKKKLESLKAEHNQIIAKLTDKQEIKDMKHMCTSII